MPAAEPKTGVCLGGVSPRQLLRDRHSHPAPDGGLQTLARARNVVGALTIVLATITTPLSAATWESELNVGTSVLFETNPRYESDEDKESETGLDTSIEGSIARKTPRGLVSINPTVRQTFYPDDNGDGSESNNSLEHLDFRLPGSAQWRTPRLELGISAAYGETSTRESEFQTAVPDPDDPVPPGSTRLVEIDEVQQNWYLRPTFAYALSPVDILSGYASRIDISYEEDTQPGYESTGAGATIEHAFDAKNYISASLDGSVFKSSNVPGAFPVDNETDNYSAAAGFRHELSETQSIDITAGAATSDFTVTEKAIRPIGLPCFDPGAGQFVPCRFEGSDSNFVGGLVYSLSSQVTNSTVSISRAIRPSSDGFTVTQDSFSAYVVRTISQRLRISTGGYLITEEIVGKGEAGGIIGQRLDREYWRLEVSATWNLTRKWSLRGLYRYTSNDQGVGSADEENHEVRLGMRYKVLEYR